MRELSFVVAPFPCLFSYNPLLYSRPAMSEYGQTGQKPVPLLSCDHVQERKAARRRIIEAAIHGFAMQDLSVLSGTKCISTTPWIPRRLQPIGKLPERYEDYSYLPIPHIVGEWVFLLPRNTSFYFYIPIQCGS